MKDRLVLRSERNTQASDSRLPRSGVGAAYLLLLVAVMAVVATSVLARHRADSSLEGKASRGEPQALYLMGKRYFDTAMSSHDYARAARLVQRSAAAGYAPAQTGLGLLYEHGLGVSKNYEAAVDWLSRAARQGHPVAQNELGVLYAKGRGTPRDFAQATKWLRLAAKHGSDVARRNLQLVETTSAKTYGQLSLHDKRTYDQVSFQKVESDGITVSFSPATGGLGMAKVKMEDLPSDLQQMCKIAGAQGQAENSAYSQVGTVSNAL